MRHAPGEGQPRRQCARCEHIARDKLIAPSEVPAEFWQTEQFHDAFAAQHMGRVARAYRTHPHHHAAYGPGGISQALLGQWLGLSQAQVSRIETGPPIRNLDTLAYWARVLHIPAPLLWFDMPGSDRMASEADGRALHSGDARNGHAADTAIRLWVTTEPITTAKAVGSATQSASKDAALTWLLTLGVDSAQRTNGSPSVGQAEIEALNAMHRSLIALDDEHGGGAVLPMGMAYLRTEVVPLLQGRYDERIGRRLFAAVAGLALTTGLIAYDAGRHGLARRQLLQVLRLSHVSTERALGGQILATMSHHALYLGDYNDALLFARAASNGVKTCSSAVRASCAATEARALAARGEQRTCFALMDEAEQAFAKARSDDHPVWLSFLDEAELAGKFGRCLRDLGLHADAARQLETSLVLHKTSYPRSRAITQMIYATNYARQGQLEPACQLGIAAIPAVGRLRSQRTREYLRDLRDHLAPYRHEPQVREFSEQARELLAAGGK